MKIALRVFILIYGFLLSNCQKDKCQTCTKTIGGIAGNITQEVRKVCNEKEAEMLEASSTGTTVWKCE